MDTRVATRAELPKIVELLATRGWDDSNTLERDSWYIVAAEQGIVACMQVVEVESGHSVVDQVLVREDLRSTGIGRRLMRHAITISRGTLYLCCHPDLLKFYGHFDFVDVGYRNVPRSIQDYWVLIEDYPAQEGHVHHFLAALH